MAGSVNKVILIGNLGIDPEIKTFQNGGRVANLSLATSETWKDRDSGERREKTEWHRIAVFNERLIDIIERFVKKGSNGKIQNLQKINDQLREICKLQEEWRNIDENENSYEEDEDITKCTNFKKVPPHKKKHLCITLDND